jgi:hypothetical protein
LRESLTSVVYEGREPSDTEFLLRDLFEQQHRLRKHNSEDVRISELQIQIDLLFADKGLHELIVETAAGCLKADLKEEGPLALMLAVVANLRNIELARLVLLNLWDRIYARAQCMDSLRFNKFSVAAFVDCIAQFISITEAIKQKEELVMDLKRTAPVRRNAPSSVTQRRRVLAYESQKDFQAGIHISFPVVPAETHSEELEAEP